MASSQAERRPAARRPGRDCTVRLPLTRTRGPGSSSRPPPVTGVGTDSRARRQLGGAPAAESPGGLRLAAWPLGPGPGPAPAWRLHGGSRSACCFSHCGLMLNLFSPAVTLRTTRTAAGRQIRLRLTGRGGRRARIMTRKMARRDECANWLRRSLLFERVQPKLLFEHLSCKLRVRTQLEMIKIRMALCQELGKNPGAMQRPSICMQH